MCRNQLLKKIGKNNVVELKEKNKGNDEDHDEVMEFNPLIVDELEEFVDIKEQQFNAMEKTLEKIKQAGGPLL